MARPDHVGVVSWAVVGAQMVLVFLVVCLVIFLIDIGVYGLPSEYGFAQSGGDVEAPAS